MVINKMRSLLSRLRLSSGRYRCATAFLFVIVLSSLLSYHSFMNKAFSIGDLAKRTLAVSLGPFSGWFVMYFRAGRMDTVDIVYTRPKVHHKPTIPMAVPLCIFRINSHLAPATAPVDSLPSCAWPWSIANVIRSPA